MKDGIITIRISNDKKKLFETVCKSKSKTISSSIVEYINNEINLFSQNNYNRINYQLNNTNMIINEDELNSLSIKEYSSGREIQIGDQILRGVLLFNNNTHQMITFNINELCEFKDAKQIYVICNDSEISNNDINNQHFPYLKYYE